MAELGPGEVASLSSSTTPRHLLSGASILVCDDDPALLAAIASFLRQAGCSVTEAGSVLEAERAMFDTRFDALLLDLRFPEGDPLSVLEFARRHELPCSALMLSASSEERDLQRCIAAGALDFLVKPPDPREVLDALSHAVHVTRTWQARLAHARGKTGDAGGSPQGDGSPSETGSTPQASPQNAAPRKAGAEPNTLERSRSSHGVGPVAGFSRRRIESMDNDGRSRKLDVQPWRGSNVGTVSEAHSQASASRQMVRDIGERLGLTPRETEVLELLRRGRSDQQIALVLQFSPRTAKFHVANILKKLACTSRYEVQRMFMHASVRRTSNSTRGIPVSRN